MNVWLKTLHNSQETSCELLPVLKLQSNQPNIIASIESQCTICSTNMTIWANAPPSRIKYFNRLIWWWPPDINCFSELLCPLTNLMDMSLTPVAWWRGSILYYHLQRPSIYSYYRSQAIIWKLKIGLEAWSLYFLAKPPAATNPPQSLSCHYMFAHW